VTWREITVDKFDSLTNALLVDVRSPCEHKAEYIPGSVNVPLLSDKERIVVGTIYAERGEFIARREALRLITPKIPAIVETILSLRAGGHPIVIHCWRGGLRSEAVAGFLSIIGIECYRLVGGYKAWRNQLLNDLKAN